MISKPAEIRYLHAEKIVFVDYAVDQKQVNLPIEHLYKYFTSTTIEPQGYLISIEDKNNGIQFGFSDQKTFLITWVDLMDLVNKFNQGSIAYEQE